jgi:hypothetical protein
MKPVQLVPTPAFACTTKESPKLLVPPIPVNVPPVSVIVNVTASPAVEQAPPPPIGLHDTEPVKVPKPSMFGLELTVVPHPAMPVPETATERVPPVVVASNPNASDWDWMYIGELSKTVIVRVLVPIPDQLTVP